MRELNGALSSDLPAVGLETDPGVRTSGWLSLQLIQDGHVWAHQLRRLPVVTRYRPLPSTAAASDGVGAPT